MLAGQQHWRPFTDLRSTYTNSPASSTLFAVELTLTTASMPERPTVPLYHTDFIGRAAELADVRARLAAPNAPRLFTLAGPGGCGKTRLAARLAADHPPAAAPGGVWWVELAGVADPALVPQSVADVLGLREAPPQPLVETLVAFLGPQPALVILDNCEHLLPACADLTARLLKTCPALRVLTTSREPLGLAGEVVWPVPPLTLPTPNPTASPDSIAQADAVQLFVERARRDLPAFALTPANAAAVAEVCRQVEGLPLAIELAAARVPMLRVEQIVDRLRDQLRLLAGGGPDRPPRQQTLRATLDWSHALLTAPERALLRRVSVFAGGWRLEAAESVSADADSTLETLTQLVRKSLVVVEREPGQDARFRLLDTVRQYAAEQLQASGEHADAHDRHLAYFTRLAEAPRAHLGFFLADADTGAWLARLRPELDNLRTALAWSTADPARRTAGLRLMTALHWFWFIRGYFTEARHWLERLLAGAVEVPQAVRARALTTAGWLACWQGAFAGARDPLEESLRLARELGDPWGEAFSLHPLGWAAAALGDGPRGRELIAACLGIARRLGDLWLIGFSLHFLGIGAAFQGEFSLARAHFEECISLMRQTGGNAAGLAFSLFHLGRMDRLEGQYAPAADHYQEALRLFRMIGDPRGAAYALAGLAGLSVAQGNLRHAARLFGAVAALRARVGPFLEAPLQVEHDRDLAAVRSALPPEAFATAWGEGQADPSAAEMPPAGPAPEAAVRPLLVPVPEVELRLLGLGPAEVILAGRQLRAADWKFARPKHLIFYLASHNERTREQIGLAFWPEATPEQLRTGLRSALYRLRQALGRPEWVRYEHERYAFNRALGYWYDVEAFQSGITEAARHAPASPKTAIEPLAQTLALYRGDFLEDFPDLDWVTARREALRQQHLQGLLSLGRLLLEAGRPTEAADAYRQAIARDGYLEAAHRGLMRCFARQGEPGQALRHYQSLAAQLVGDLGTAPAPETARLHDQLLRGEPI